MTLKDIPVGTRLELELLNKSGDKMGNTLVSQFLEYHNEELIVISAPIFEARLFFIPDDVQIRLTFVNRQHGLLGFTAIVKAKEFRGNIGVLLIEPAGNIEKIQRRMNFRLEIVLFTRFWFPEEEIPTPLKAVTKNISGSGICLISENDIPKNTEVKVEIDLTESLTISAKCIVLRNLPAEARKGKRFELGMRFTEITKKNQDALIKFIFDQQRLRLKIDK